MRQRSQPRFPIERLISDGAQWKWLYCLDCGSGFWAFTDASHSALTCKPRRGSSRTQDTAQHAHDLFREMKKAPTL